MPLYFRPLLPSNSQRSLSNNMSILPFHVQNLSLHYGGQSAEALSNVSWSAPAGQLSAIIGPNGAGKSTLFKAAMGLLNAQKGQVQFFGENLDDVRGQVSYMPQRTAVDWDFPVNALDVATMGLYAQIGWLKPIKRTHKEQAMAALERVKMADHAHKQIGALSGGQQQRVFLARALAQNADLYLMDEPFAGIDAKTQDLIIDIFHALKAEGKTVIVVHHDLHSAEGIFDEVLLLNKRVIAHGAASEVLSETHLKTAYSAHG